MVLFRSLRRGGNPRHTSFMNTANLWDEETAHRFLETLFPRLDELAKLWDEPAAVGPTSLIGRDDAASSPYSLSSHVSWLASVAIDNLEAAHDQIVVLGQVRPFALYSQLRAAIEASANGLWLVTHAKLTVRLRRHLSFIWSNHGDLDTFLRTLGGKHPSSVSIRVKLDAVRARHKSLQHFDVDKRIASVSDRIRDAQSRAHIKTTLSPLTAWSACSGIQHANQSVGLGLLERKEVEPDVYRISTSFVVLAGIFETAVVILEALTSEYRSRL